MNKKLQVTLALGIVTLLFSGCGGGDSGGGTSTTEDNIQTGTFVDAPV